MLVFMLQCWQTWLLRYATNKVDYFSMQCIISHRVWLSLIIYSTTFQKKCLQISNIFSSFKGNIIWTCTVLPGMSPFVEFISFAKNVVLNRFLLFFSQLLRILFLLELWNKKYRSQCLFKRKWAFILLSSLTWGESHIMYAYMLIYAH